MSLDPTVTDPDKYRAIFENDRVRVLEYKDKPGGRGSLSSINSAWDSLSPGPTSPAGRHDGPLHQVSRKGELLIGPRVTSTVATEWGFEIGG